MADYVQPLPFVGGIVVGYLVTGFAVIFLVTALAVAVTQKVNVAAKNEYLE